MEGTHAVLRNTHVSLPENTRMQTIYLLNRMLGMSVDLRAQAKQAHWNVRGPNFFALHKLFDDAAEAIDGLADEIAERIGALGGVAGGTVQIAAKLASFMPYPAEITEEERHIDALAASLAIFARTTREAIETCDDIGDVVTTDLLTGICREAEKQLWLVESHRPNHDGGQ